MNTMKKIFFTFVNDLKSFFHRNWKILLFCLITLFVIQYFGKGNILINVFVMFLHIFGDIMMIISLTKYSYGEYKSGAIYQTSAALFFLIVGYIAVLQSNEGKNWQYFLGTLPFLVANMYQICYAWNLRIKKLFNYKFTFLTTIFLALVYYQMDLVYKHAWLQIFGFSLFPIFLGMRDSPKVFLARLFSVFVMLLGVLIDIYVQLYYIGVVLPASSLSSFFITLIAFLGFIKNANMYLENLDEKDVYVRYTLNKLLIFNNFWKQKVKSPNNLGLFRLLNHELLVLKFFQFYFYLFL